MSCFSNKIVIVLATFSIFFLITSSYAQTNKYRVKIKGTDAIFLAGRDNINSIPDPGSNFILARHSYILCDFLKETGPQSIPIKGGNIVRVIKPAFGEIHFYNGRGHGFNPEGNAAKSEIKGLDGISGYIGRQGALVGIFLDDSNPQNYSAPETLDFYSDPGNYNFVRLAPELRQIFFIGDGVNNIGQNQEFVAPEGATRLFLGIADGFSFVGPAGAYEDNDGFYFIVLKIETDEHYEP
jgi:hypothetical protein